MAHTSTQAGGLGLEPQGTPLVKVGGALGIASVSVGFLIFLTACGGFDAALKLSLIPLLLGVPGLVLSVFGAVTQKQYLVEDTHVLAAIFLGVFGTLGGLLEIAGWQHWQIFY